jgi:hypothetical protein
MAKRDIGEDLEGSDLARGGGSNLGTTFDGFF